MGGLDCARFVGNWQWVDKDRDDNGSEKPRTGVGAKSFVTEQIRGVGSSLEVCYLRGIQAADYRPSGSGKLVPAGTDIVWQVHCTANGKETVDHPEVGFTVANSEPPRRYISSQVGAPTDPEHFAIPPNNPNWEAPPGEITFLADAELVWLSPHMHLRGKDMSYRLVDPDGKEAADPTFQAAAGGGSQ